MCDAAFPAFWLTTKYLRRHHLTHRLENPLCQEDTCDTLKAAGSSLGLRTDHRFYSPGGDIWSRQHRQNMMLLPLILYQAAYIRNRKTSSAECVISEGHRFFLSKATTFKARQHKMTVYSYETGPGVQKLPVADRQQVTESAERDDMQRG